MLTKDIGRLDLVGLTGLERGLSSSAAFYTRLIEWKGSWRSEA